MWPHQQFKESATFYIRLNINVFEMLKQLWFFALKKTLKLTAEAQYSLNTNEGEKKVPSTQITRKKYLTTPGRGGGGVYLS